MKKLLMIFTMLMAASVFAALPDGGPYTETVDGIVWTYMVKNGKATVGANGQKAVPYATSGAITIPSTLDGCPVTSIGEYAFCFYSGLTSVTIPSSVTSIGACAFLDCDGLTSVTIPSSVTNIGRLAFADCSGLMAISVDTANANYKSKNGLLVSKDGTVLVQGINGDVTIPSSVTSIGDDAFAGCSGLTSVKIPTSVTSIGYDAFLGCYGLGDGVVIVDGCVLAVNDTCPTTVKIPNGTRLIAGGVFSYLEDLRHVTIPSSVTSIGERAFEECSGLVEISVVAGNKHYASEDGILFNKSKTEIIVYPSSKSGRHYAIPSGVTSIGEYAFCLCRGLTSVTISSSVTSIGESAFTYCYGLTSVTIPSSVTSIGYYAFCDCDALETIYVAKGDTQRVKKMLEESTPYEDFDEVTFVENLDPTPGSESRLGFEDKHTFNGLVTDEFGMCGMIQVATARKDKKGNVKVSGFVMLEDGKKQSIRGVTAKVSGGAVEVATKVGKTSLSLTITDDGFTGTLGDMAVASADIGEETGIVSGTLKMSYFDAKTGKIKTKSVTIKGLANGDAADISATVKGQGEKFFRAEIVE